MVDHHNRVLAGGEVAHQFDAGTWLRLAIEGLVKLENKRITVDAATAVKKVEKE